MLKLLLGDPNTRKLKRYYPIVSDVNIFEEDLVGLSDDQLRSRTSEFRTRLAKLPTPVRNKMGFMKKGGMVKKRAKSKSKKSRGMGIAKRGGNFKGSF